MKNVEPVVVEGRRMESEPRSISFLSGLDVTFIFRSKTLKKYGSQGGTEVIFKLKSLLTVLALGEEAGRQGLKILERSTKHMRYGVLINKLRKNRFKASFLALTFLRTTRISTPKPLAHVIWPTQKEINFSTVSN